MNAQTFWHTSTYIFIYGFIWYKTCKYTNVFYLWLCTLFYSIMITFYFNKFKPKIYKQQINYKDFFIVIYPYYWCFTSNFVMYLFLPIINKGLGVIINFELKIAVLLFLIFVYKDYINPKNVPFKMNKG